MESIFLSCMFSDQQLGEGSPAVGAVLCSNGAWYQHQKGWLRRWMARELYGQVMRDSSLHRRRERERETDEPPGVCHLVTGEYITVLLIRRGFWCKEADSCNGNEWLLNGNLISFFLFFFFASRNFFAYLFFQRL